jgi:hypothetical protein
VTNGESPAGVESVSTQGGAPSAGGNAATGEDQIDPTLVNWRAVRESLGRGTAPSILFGVSSRTLDRASAKVETSATVAAGSFRHDRRSFLNLASKIAVLYGVAIIISGTLGALGARFFTTSSLWIVISSGLSATTLLVSILSIAWRKDLLRAWLWERTLAAAHSPADRRAQIIRALQNVEVAQSERSVQGEDSDREIIAYVEALRNFQAEFERSVQEKKRES